MVIELTQHVKDRFQLSFRFTTSALTLSGFAGGEYLPLPASEGLAFPFLLTLDGYPNALGKFRLRIIKTLQGTFLVS